MDARITGVTPDIAALGIETKELFVLAEIDERQHPAELAQRLCMPTPSVTVYVKHLEGAGFVRRIMARGLTLLSEAFGARLARLSAAEQRSAGCSWKR